MRFQLTRTVFIVSARGRSRVNAMRLLHVAFVLGSVTASGCTPVVAEPQPSVTQTPVAQPARRLLIIEVGSGIDVPARLVVADPSAPELEIGTATPAIIPPRGGGEVLFRVPEEGDWGIFVFAGGRANRFPVVVASDFEGCSGRVPMTIGIRGENSYGVERDHSAASGCDWNDQ